MNVDAAKTLINVAGAHTWVVEQGGANRGQAVEAILKFVGLAPGNPWCAAFVAYIGRAVFGEAWPLPKVGGCATLGEFAHNHGLMFPAPPKAGDVFLLYSAEHRRFNHTGFVAVVHPDGSYGTIEGNTSPDGSPEGTGVFRRVRRFGPRDRFIRTIGG